MKTTGVQSAIGLAIALAVFLGGMSLGLVISQWRADKIGDAATWAGAALAGLAFGGTIWIAIAGERKRLHQDRLRAHIAGAQLYYDVSALRDEMDTVRARLVGYRSVDRGGEDLKAIAKLVGNFRLWKRESLEPLLDFDPALVAILVHCGSGTSMAMHSFVRFDQYDQPGARVLYALATEQLFIKALEGLNFASNCLSKYHIDVTDLKAVHAASG